MNCQKLFGSRQSFAIEVMLHPQSGGPRDAPYGSLWYWVAGKRIGDANDPVFLRSIAVNLETILKAEGLDCELIVPESSAVECVETAAAMLREGQSTGIWDPEILTDHILTDGNPPFDAIFSIYGRRHDGGIIVWKDTRSGANGFVELRRDEFKDTAEAFLDWLEEALAPAEVDTLRETAVPDRKGVRWYSKLTGREDYCVFTQREGRLVFSHLIPSTNARNIVPVEILDRFRP